MRLGEGGEGADGGREEARLPVLAGVCADAGRRGVGRAVRVRARRHGLAAVLARLQIYNALAIWPIHKNKSQLTYYIEAFLVNYENSQVLTSVTYVMVFILIK